MDTYLIHLSMEENREARGKKTQLYRQLIHNKGTKNI